MEVRFTRHALDQMRDREISRFEVQMVIAQPYLTRVGETAIDYYGTVDRRRLRVIVARGSDPALVITVFERMA